MKMLRAPSASQAESARYGASAKARSGDPYFISSEGAHVVDCSEPVQGAYKRVAHLHAARRE
jgi:hypothetical protein